MNIEIGFVGRGELVGRTFLVGVCSRVKSESSGGGGLVLQSLGRVMRRPDQRCESLSPVGGSIVMVCSRIFSK